VRFKVRKKALFFGIILVGLGWFQAGAQTPREERLFQEAKILLFDEAWAEAQEKLEDLLANYPRSPLAAQAVFYRAKCLGKQKGKEKDALEAYEDYLKRRDKNQSFIEESETSIIELSYDLYSRGQKSHLDDIEQKLDSPNRVVRYYAAIKLSQVRDESAAEKAIPVLKQIIREENDPDLKDRARVALLRVSPSDLRRVEGRREEAEGKAKILKIRVRVRGQKEPELSFNIPWALADLALRAIPEEDRAALRKEGYDLDGIIDKLLNMKERIIRIFNKDRTIEIWID
jgi:hypothetical protein